jgi:copper homeostasis protein CutC
MIDEICEDDAEKWQEATDCAKQALEMRINLWNGLLTPSASISTED